MTYKKYLTYSNITIKTAMKKLSDSGNKCLIIIDKKSKLIGTLSDGDIRKSLLSNHHNINKSISFIYNKKPSYIDEDQFDKERIKNIFIKKAIDVIPIVNRKKEVINVVSWDYIFIDKKKYISKQNKIFKKTPVIVMAGGSGTRLAPFTHVLPKSLMPVDGKTIIERIIENFENQGLKSFHFITNYKGLILKAYLKELRKGMKFHSEKKPLGTAGGLYLIKKLKEKDFIVVNCDNLFEIDYHDLLNYHFKSKCDITIVVLTKNYILPYGSCITHKQGLLKKIIEKPQTDVLVNSGLYVMNKKILKLVKNNKFLNMNELLNVSVQNKFKVKVYPIDESSWKDFGQWDNYFKNTKS